MKGLPWVIALLGLALAGCARPNPAYDAKGDSTSGDDGSTSTSAAGEGDSTASSADGPDPSTSTGEPDGVCEFDLPPGTFEIRNAKMEPLPGGCMGGGTPPPLFYQLQQAPMNNGTLAFGNVCTNCGCDAVINADLTLAFDIPLPPFEGTECFIIDRVYDSSGEGCQLLSYAIRQGDEVLSIVSNEVEAGVFDELGVDLSEESLDDCTEECNGDPVGDYGLVFFVEPEPVEVGPQEANVPVGDFRVTNEHSYIDDQCESIVRWHARRMPPG